MKHIIIFIATATIAFGIIAALPKMFPKSPSTCLAGKDSIMCVGSSS